MPIFPCTAVEPSTVGLRRSGAVVVTELSELLRSQGLVLLVHMGEMNFSLISYGEGKWYDSEVWDISSLWDRPWSMGKGDQEEQGRYRGRKKRVLSITFWKVILAEGMSVPCGMSTSAAHPDKWRLSKVQITLVHLLLSFTSAFLFYLGLVCLAPPPWSQHLNPCLRLPSEDEDKTECRIHHAV